jgi:tetratricopeptide (TPR) repeat protein
MNNDASESAVRSKIDWLKQIEQCLACGEYNQAKSLTQSALSKFPDDPEILALEEKAIQGRENRALAFQLMQDGQELCKEQNFREGLSVLRDAYAMDVRCAEARSELVKGLLNHARAAISSDPHAAESSIREAIDLDPRNSVAKSLQQMIQGRKPAAAALSTVIRNVPM